MVAPSLSLWASVRLPWSRFQPPLTELGVPISGKGLSSVILRLAHRPPDRGGDSAGGPAVRAHEDGFFLGLVVGWPCSISAGYA